MLIDLNLIPQPWQTKWEEGWGGGRAPGARRRPGGNLGASRSDFWKNSLEKIVLFVEAGDAEENGGEEEEEDEGAAEGLKVLGLA